jgi:hypothetical protein
MASIVMVRLRKPFARDFAVHCSRDPTIGEVQTMSSLDSGGSGKDEARGRSVDGDNGCTSGEDVRGASGDDGGRGEEGPSPALDRG